jgi:hypothetical protein
MGAPPRRQPRGRRISCVSIVAKLLPESPRAHKILMAIMKLSEKSEFPLGRGSQQCGPLFLRYQRLTCQSCIRSVRTIGSNVLP